MRKIIRTMPHLMRLIMITCVFLASFFIWFLKRISSNTSFRLQHFLLGLIFSCLIRDILRDLVRQTVYYFCWPLCQQSWWNFMLHHVKHHSIVGLIFPTFPPVSLLSGKLFLGVIFSGIFFSKVFFPGVYFLAPKNVYAWKINGY